MEKRLKILFMAEGITAAHFTRAAALAETLSPEEWIVSFATPKRYHSLLQPGLEKIIDLKTLNPQSFLDALERGKVMYPFETIKENVADDLSIIDDVKPDLIIGDYRLSLCASAPLSGIPFCAIYNAYWSPSYIQPPEPPELPITHLFPLQALRPIYRILRPAIYRAHGRPVNQARKHYGLKPLPTDDIQKILTYGGLVVYPDIPELYDFHELPNNHKFIGHVDWATRAPKPEWWAEAFSGEKPKVFFTMGSSGSTRVIDKVLEALSQLDARIIFATSGKPIAQDQTRFVSELLPYQEAISGSDLFISNGGSMSILTSMSLGKPMLAIPSNIDTQQASQLLNRTGSGLVLRPEGITVEKIKAAVALLLSEQKYKNQARAWQNTFKKHDYKSLFPKTVKEFLRGKRKI